MCSHRAEVLFDCGVSEPVVAGTGRADQNATLAALQEHLTSCQDPDCRSSVEREIAEDWFQLISEPYGLGAPVRLREQAARKLGAARFGGVVFNVSSQVLLADPPVLAGDVMYGLADAATGRVTLTQWHYDLEAVR